MRRWRRRGGATPGSSRRAVGWGRGGRRAGRRGWTPERTNDYSRSAEKTIRFLKSSLTFCRQLLNGNTLRLKNNNWKKEKREVNKKAKKLKIPGGKLVEVG